MPSSSLAVASGPEEPHIPMSPAPASPAGLPPQAQASAVATDDTILHDARPRDIDTGRPPCYRSPAVTATLNGDPGASIPEARGAPMPDRALSPQQVLVAPREPLV